MTIIKTANVSQLMFSIFNKKDVTFCLIISILLTVRVTATVTTAPIYLCWIFYTHHTVSYCAYKSRVFRRFAHIWSGLAGLSSNLFSLQHLCYVGRSIAKPDACWIILSCYEVELLSTSRISIWRFIDEYFVALFWKLTYTTGIVQFCILCNEK